MGELVGLSIGQQTAAAGCVGECRVTVQLTADQVRSVGAGAVSWIGAEAGGRFASSLDFLAENVSRFDAELASYGEGLVGVDVRAADTERREAHRYADLQSRLNG